MKCKFLLILAALAMSNLVSAADLPPAVSESVVNAPRAEVWRAWTTSAGLQSWLAPVADIELRLDGLMRTNYKQGGSLNDAGAIENRILAFEPERLLVLKVSKAPSSFPFPKAVQSMWTVIYLSDEEHGKTRIRAVGLGFTDDEESSKMREFFQRGNDYTLEELRQHFGK
jgi:uncharacterized protein YndB with AHSA1/START domain